MKLMRIMMVVLIGLAVPMVACAEIDLSRVQDESLKIQVIKDYELLKQIRFSLDKTEPINIFIEIDQKAKRGEGRLEFVNKEAWFIITARPTRYSVLHELLHTVGHDIHNPDRKEEFLITSAEFLLRGITSEEVANMKWTGEVCAK